jgi:hypothetical protein
MRFTHDVRLYYGKNAKPPRKAGALAIAVNTCGHATDMEIQAGKSRPEIGRITVSDLMTNKVEVIQEEHQPTTTP